MLWLLLASSFGIACLGGLLSGYAHASEKTGRLTATKAMILARTGNVIGIAATIVASITACILAAKLICIVSDAISGK